jgi:hypothetical protein
VGFSSHGKILSHSFAQHSLPAPSFYMIDPKCTTRQAGVARGLFLEQQSCRSCSGAYIETSVFQVFLIKPSGLRQLSLLWTIKRITIAILVLGMAARRSHSLQ